VDAKFRLAPHGVFAYPMAQTMEQSILKINFFDAPSHDTPQKMPHLTNGANEEDNPILTS